MIQRKKVNLVFQASKGIKMSYFLLSKYDKPRIELVLGENCIKIISDKSNPLAMSLQI